MIRNNLADQREPQAGAVFPARDKRIEDISLDVLRQSRPVVDNLNLKRQGLARSVRASQPERVLEVTVQTNRTRRVSRRLRRILQQIEYHLQQLIRIAIGQWQRGVVVFYDFHMRPEPEQRRPPCPIQHVVDVHGLKIRF